MNIQTSCGLTEVLWSYRSHVNRVSSYHQSISVGIYWQNNLVVNCHLMCILACWWSFNKGWLEGFNDLFTVIVVIVYSPIIAQRSAQKLSSRLIKFVLFYISVFKISLRLLWYVEPLTWTSALRLSETVGVLAGASLGVICSAVGDRSVLESGERTAERPSGTSNIYCICRGADRNARK